MVDALDTFLAAKLVNTSWIKPSADVGPEGGESRKRRAGSRTQGSAPGYMNRQGKAMSGKPGPLPFGVLPPAAKSVEITNDTLTRARPGLHCLSAFCPPATVIQQWDTLAQKWVSIAFRRSAPRLLGSGNRDTNEQCPVSIAFRRSAPRLPDVPCRYGEPVENCLHCLSAFCPPATGRIERHCGWPIWRLHCLSAFCPPATGRLQYNAEKV